MFELVNDFHGVPITTDFVGDIAKRAALRSWAKLALNLAARWAAKEAVAKLLGVGIRGLASGADAIPWHDIQIQRDAVGKPQIVLHRHAATIAAAQGLFSFDISISHDGEYTIASAVAIGLTLDA